MASSITTSSTPHGKNGTSFIPTRMQVGVITPTWLLTWKRSYHDPLESSGLISTSNPAKSNIYWHQDPWVSAPATVVKFMETLIRLSLCHHVVFQGHRSTDCLLQDQWNQLDNIKCNNSSVEESATEQYSCGIWNPSPTRVTNAILEYVTGKKIALALQLNRNFSWLGCQWQHHRLLGGGRYRILGTVTYKSI